MGKYNNIRYRDEGYAITIQLSQFNSDPMYDGYAASCQYQYNKQKEKYSLRMWLMHKSFDGKFKLEFESIDTQYISGTRETIRGNICRVVDQMMKNGFFDEYIGWFEYDLECFRRGDEVLRVEQEASEKEMVDDV